MRRITVCLFLAYASWADKATPESRLSSADSALLETIQRDTFGYFWEFAHPDSGMARERSTSGNLVTSGGSGFGVLSIIAATERGWIEREAAVARMLKITAFLAKADRFHGAWPHWLNGKTGKVIPFSPKDDGADLVETAFLMQGLLTAREYFNADETDEKVLRGRITELWESVEWDWFTNQGNALLWHWSPTYGFEKNHRISGWNECLVTYVLSASSPTHPIDPAVYHEGWARSGRIANNTSHRDITVPLGRPEGGPLFFAHYSFLCLDPRGLRDRYADYWEQCVNHARVNHLYCTTEAKPEYQYSERCWGITASDNPWGYSAHQPGVQDNGTIAPTAALASIPYLPEESLAAARYFHDELGGRLQGPHGFYDAFNLKEDWFATQHLAIDQGPIVVMIENHRTGLLWNTFMQCPEIQAGLKRLGFERASSASQTTPSQTRSNRTPEP